MGRIYQGQEGLYIGEEVGFTDLIYFDDLTKADFEAGKAKGKILFTFLTDRFTDQMAEFAKSKGVVGIIIATKPIDLIEPGTAGIASARVDYEIGMDILLYLQTTK